MRTASMFDPIHTLPQVSEHWCETRDCDPNAEALFVRHYSCANRNRRGCGFVGPGQKMVLIAVDGTAVFAWLKQAYRMDGQLGVNCTIFRNEGHFHSSALIREASALAWVRWPGTRLFTFVDPSRIRSSNPGCCFKRAGWKSAGTTSRGLVVLEQTP